MHARGLRLRGADDAARENATHRVAFPYAQRGRHPGKGDYGAQYPACMVPLSTLASCPCGRTAMTRGRGRSLLPHGMALASTTLRQLLALLPGTPNSRRSAFSSPLRHISTLSQVHRIATKRLRRPRDTMGKHAHRMPEQSASRERSPP